MRSELLSEIEQRLEHPTARDLAHAVGRAISDGVVAPGAKLPPIREVATQLALSPTTVSAGWALLTRAGTIRTDGRRGTTVVGRAEPRAGRYRQALDRQPPQDQAPFRIDLCTGVPDAALLPSLTGALAALTTAGTPGSYLDEPVLPELREVLRADWPYDPAELTIVDGAMDGLDLVARSVLRFGDRVAIEDPCFPPLVDLLEAVGAQVVALPVDGDGPEPDALADALHSPLAAVVLQPRAQNPTGVSLAAGRADALAGLLEGTSTLVVEDDSAGATSISPPTSLGSRLPDRTVHVRSFSKSHGPDLRLAAMSGPDDVLAAVAARRQNGQGWSSRLLQRILLSLLTDHAAGAAVAAARHEYARRRRLVVDALAAAGVAVGGTDGINIWVPVHDESAAIVRLASQGIGVTPGTPFTVAPSAQDHIRVTVGLLADGHAEVAEQIAAAARTSGWRSRGR
ncbi:PLP-dependent aminotransferase family protein [Pseudonocardia kunmingensis]|uniref:DNA-binding transcriptional MocR family regulator n=1 Tax=Pseudonocardia kunmingensis TaxID=630975 RepID=A0A543DNI2_9PSEU|nr:aminotransferase class I/II-fold pyridoxal phosphate-dependent enzyme [Pseudonocardia kunmingensis]TQM10880.1 DNA-binding transcriptional MocR family regulator [Pseudonocardia kunmingensis]